MSIYTIRETDKSIAELKELISFYNSIDESLVDKFLKDYMATLDKLIQSPNSYYNISSELRRIPFHRFKCIIIYSIQDSIITIISVKDMRIHPDKFFK